jgi:hypothetical protein
MTAGPAPTLAGFLQFIRGTMQIPTAALPDDDVQIGYAYNVSITTVAPSIQCVSPLIYMLAVYNLAADNLLNWANDQASQTFFADARAKYGMLSFVAGVISSTADVSTSESLTVPESIKGLTLSDLQNLKSPYGRQYLAWAQKYGTLWGLS